jgi:hypothetical protein
VDKKHKVKGGKVHGEETGGMYYQYQDVKYKEGK